MDNQQIERIQAKHHYALTMLYKAGAGEYPHGRSEDYWHGALNGIEAVMHALGIEHEMFNPFGYMEYLKED